MAREVILHVILLCLLQARVRAAEICCDGVGCFTDDPPYDGLPLPQCAEQLNLNIQVYTRRNSDTGQDINRNTIPNVFNGLLLSIYIIHGWIESQDEVWVHDMKDALLEQGDYNVIIVGWTGGSETLNYFQSAGDIRTVGAEIALIANNTIKNGASAQSRLYCIGFSLGAHICGEAGARLKFGRITGLDAAGPLFKDRDIAAGLNPSCADLVDVMHTDGLPTLELLTLGMLVPRGHIDFYPNGGGRQPKCPGLNPILSGLIPTLTDLLSLNFNNLKEDVIRMVACNHEMAPIYYTESVRTPCFLSGYSCTDPNSLPVSCTWSDAPQQSMGFDANQYSARGIFYLTTNAAAPYCRGNGNGDSSSTTSNWDIL